MSEEFLRVAKQEVSDDIAEIGNLLKECFDDSSISQNAVKIEKHIHKLKGLAPMMGQTEIGDIAAAIDTLLKLVISGKSIPDVFQTIKKSQQFMLNAINDVKSDYDSLKNDLNKKYSAFLSLK